MCQNPEYLCEKSSHGETSIMSHASQFAEPEVRGEAAQLLMKADALQGQALKLFEEGRQLMEQAEQLRARARSLSKGDDAAEMHVPASLPPLTQEACRLTSRQRNVAVLIARGCSNKQIAKELIITQGTAANHVRNILQRLDFQSRAQIAAWAVQNGPLTAH